MEKLFFLMRRPGRPGMRLTELGLKRSAEPRTWKSLSAGRPWGRAQSHRHAGGRGIAELGKGNWWEAAEVETKARARAECTSGGAKDATLLPGFRQSQ